MPIMKFALGRIDEYLFNALRLTLSAIVLGICTWGQKASVIDRTAGAKPLKLQLCYVVLFAFMTGFAYQVLFLLGIDSTSAGNTAIIMSAIPMWTAILAMVLLKERLSQLAWVGLTIALFGTLVVTLSKTDPSSASVNTVTGNLLVSAAAFSWALASVVSRPMLQNTSPVALAFCSVGGALPLHFWIARQAIGETWQVFSDPWLMSALLYSGIFSTGLAYAFWNYGVKHLGPSHAASFQNLVPLIALFAGWILIGEVPFALQLLGGALIITGLIVMRHRGTPGFAADAS